LVNKPTSHEARLLLADLYRRDGHHDEAGRWSYLSPNAEPRERAAYEHACAHRLHSSWTATYIRKGLHWPQGLLSEDDTTNALLASLDSRAAAERRSWERKIQPFWRRWRLALHT
jgi:hypothetical protein